MLFAPTRNNRVAPRKRTLTSPIPTVKDGVARRRRPATLNPRASFQAPVSTPMSAPSVKTGTVRPPRPPRPQMRINAEPIKVAKQPFIGVKAKPLKTRINKKKSR